MNTELNEMIGAIAMKRNELSELTYDDPKYDEVEEDLHDLEDELLDEFGDDLDGIVREVHERIASDAEILLPIAYMAKKYLVEKDGYAVAKNEGVIIKLNNTKEEVRLVLVPSPLRFILNKKSKQEIVWTEN